jgi:hypothetical protein
MMVEDGTALRLTGSPRERGAEQAACRPGLATAVRVAAERRDLDTDAARTREGIRRFLDRQYEFAATHCAAELAEVEGIAQGFRLDPRAVFNGLHASAISDLAAAEGCTSWAAADGEGALLAKNRDIRADLLPLQDVMLHI